MFGAEWSEAGEYARWLSAMYLLRFANAPAVAATATLELQRGLAVYEILSAGLKVGALYTGLVLLDNETRAVSLYGLVGALSYGGLIGWVILEARRTDARCAKTAKTSADAGHGTGVEE